MRTILQIRRQNSTSRLVYPTTRVINLDRHQSPPRIIKSMVPIIQTTMPTIPPQHAPVMHNPNHPRPTYHPKTLRKYKTLTKNPETNKCPKPKKNTAKT
jgi:hypothetical protein